LRSRKGAFGWLLEKEYRELVASRSWWVMLLLMGPLVGVSFISAVRTYGEASGLNGTAVGVGEAFSPLVGVWAPTFSACELAAAFLLPFVAIRSLGAGDWKLVGALGAFIGPGSLLDVLLVTVLVAGMMAAALIVWKGRVRQTLRNMLHILASFFSFHLPGPEVSLDSKQSLKIPFGVAVAVAVIVFSARQIWGVA